MLVPVVNVKLVHKTVEFVKQTVVAYLATHVTQAMESKMIL